jgi:hypothetical protein
MVRKGGLVPAGSAEGGDARLTPALPHRTSESE